MAELLGLSHTSWDFCTIPGLKEEVTYTVPTSAMSTPMLGPDSCCTFFLQREVDPSVHMAYASLWPQASPSRFWSLSLACFLSASRAALEPCLNWIHFSQRLPVPPPHPTPCAQCPWSVHCPSSVSQGSLLCDFPAVLLFPTSCFSFQLNLIHSEISNLAGFEVEAIINPTNADIDLKDDLGNWGWGLAPPAVR